MTHPIKELSVGGADGARVIDWGDGFVLEGTTYPVDHHLPPHDFDFYMRDDVAEELVDWLLAQLGRRREL